MESIIARRGFIVRGVVLLVCVVLGTTLLFRATTYSAPNSPPEANSAMPSYLVFDRPDWDGDHQRDLIRSYPSGQGASEHGDSGIRRGEVLIHSYLSWGSNVQKEVIYQLRGRKPGDHFGSSVLSPGDLNFDGLDDLIISAPDHKEARRPRPGEDALSTSTGQVYIMYGRHPQAQDLARIARGKNTIPISLLRGTDYILASPSPMENERFGTQLGLVTDADEDGWPDIRIRSEVSQPDGSIRYYTTFYSGKSGKALRRVGGKGEELLWKQIPGDLNQDGVVDIDDLLNVLAALSADGDTMQDPWVDEASGIEALTLGDANGDGVTDIDDLLVTLTNYDLNQFKFMFPSMHGRDDSGIEGQARGGSCPECEFCPNYCECIIHAPFPGFHCCCDGQLMCGSFINPWETCDGGNPIPCNTGFCSMSLSCDYVQVGGTPVYLTLGYSAPSPPCGKKWRLYFSPQISVKQGLTPIVSGMLYNLPAGTLTIEGVSPSAICGDVLLEWTVFKSDGVTGVCGAIDSMTSYKFDIDVDSDNDGTGLAYQKHEAIGMTPPGLMVMTALEDSDDDLIAPDYIPDFADGIERWSSSEPQDTSGASLDPMLVTVTPRCFPMELTFTYNESDPINLPVSPPAVFSDLTPPPGTLRLWSTGVDGDRHWYPLGISSKGTYVKSGTSIEISLFGSHVYIEGINAGQTTVDVDLTIGGPSCSADDQVIVTAYDCYLDVDVDSDNDDLYALPARTLAEDAIEDDPTKLGKLIPFNDDDDDGDGIVDFADGYNLDGILGNDDDVCVGEEFTPLVIDFGEAIPSTSNLIFIYDESDPNSIDPADPYGSRPLKKLRLWKKPGHEPRNPNSVGHLTDPGDFVAQSLIIPIADLGYTPGSGPIVLYLEGLDPNALGVNEQISVFTSFTTGVPNIATCFREEYVRVAVFKVDLDMDSDRNGVVEDTIEDDRREHLWDYGKTDLTATPPDYKTGAIIRVNNDDDDGDSIPDSETFVMDTPIDANDMSELWIRQLNLATLPLGWSVWLKLDDHQEYMNVHAPFPYGTILGMVEGKDEFELLATDILGSGSLVVPVEATRYPGYPDSNFDGLITLRLIVRNGPLATDSVVAEDVIQMRVAPWMMPSHLDSVMDVYVTDTFPARPASSVNGVTIAAAPSFVDRLTDALGAAGPAPIVINSGDPWPQDQYEFGYHSAPDGVWDIVLLNSPRRYGIGSPPQYPLEAYATSTIFSSDYGIYGINPPGVSYTEWPTAGGFSTRDSFGNLEAFPPKGKWTSGHVYHSSSMKIELLEFLDGQSSQNKSPDTIFDTSWLLVGHVDEFMTIQQTGPEAFRVILANTALGVYLLNQIASNDPALEFNEGQLWEDDVLRTATSLLGNLLVSDPSKDLEDYNMLIQTNYLDALKMQLQNDPTITEIIEVPGFFHEFTGPGFTPTFPNINSAASAFPDMVNLLYVDGRMIVPDPMVDEFKAVFEALVDPSPAWIDCLEYHWSIGEVHCGTNVLRAPRPEVLEWWLVDPAP